MPGLVAEPDVDQRDVGLESLDQLAALGRGARRADDLAALAAEQQLEPLAEGLMIFDEDEARGTASHVSACDASVTRPFQARAKRR